MVAEAKRVCVFSVTDARREPKEMYQGIQLG